MVLQGGRAPGGLARRAASVPEPNGVEPARRRRALAAGLCTSPPPIMEGGLGQGGTSRGGSAPARLQRAKGPALGGRTAGATTPQPAPVGRRDRERQEPPGPAAETHPQGVGVEGSGRRRGARSACRVPLGPRSMPGASCALATEVPAIASVWPALPTSRGVASGRADLHGHVPARAGGGSGGGEAYPRCNRRSADPSAVMRICTRRWTSSAASCGSRSSCPSAQQYSMAMFVPSV
jgi:hypothetical protein